MTKNNDNFCKQKLMIYPDGRMKTEDAAKYLGLSPKTLATMRCRGTGPKFIKRGRVFYFLEDLQNWVNEAERISSTAEHESKGPLCGDRR